MSLHASFTLRRLRLISGLVMFAYIAIHLLNHALGIVSLALAESGLRLEMALWRSPPATLLLYGAAAIHFSLALWTLYSRREWRLPWIEILRLASGFSFPLLLIGHAVTTRLGYTLFAIKPSYAAIITNLLMAGTQGMQLALLAPGWLHGCLGLWITLRQFHAMQRIKHLLVALVVFVPLLAAAGFLRMAAEVLAMGPPPLAGPPAVIAKVTLAAWKDYLTMAYLGAVFAAFALGQLHALVRRRAAKVSAQVFARGKLDDDERAVGEPTMPSASVMNWPSAMSTNWREVSASSEPVLRRFSSWSNL